MASLSVLHTPRWLGAIVIGITAIILVVDAHFAQSALIPPFYLNSVVAVGSMQPVSTPGHPAGQHTRLEWRTAGSAFFYGHLIAGAPDPAKRKYEIYLVTARHVVTAHQHQFGDLHVRINPKQSGAEGGHFVLPNQSSEPGTSRWFFHPDPDIDVAIIQVNLVTLRKHGFEPDFFRSEEDAADTTKLRELEASAGDGVFVIGFPMNLAGVQPNHVIVRYGVIAQLREMLDRASQTFMVDAPVYPGNSGGPVILKPEVAAIQGTKSQRRALLVGLVTSYWRYTDGAISRQAERPKVACEENSGLADVLPIDFIEETIDAWRVTRREASPAMKP